MIRRSDSDSNLREAVEGANAGVEGGHRLSDAASALLPRFELPHLAMPFSSLEVPTGVYVALGVAGAAIVGAPVLGLLLLGRGAQAVAKAAAEAAPTVAKVGPALLPLVPEAAPIVAAASLYSGATPPSASASTASGTPPSIGASSAAPVVSVAKDVVTLLRELGLPPAPVAPSAPAAAPAPPAASAPTATAPASAPIASAPAPPTSSSKKTLISSRR